MSTFIEALLKQKLIGRKQIADLMKKHRPTSKHLIELLLDMGIVKEHDLAKILSNVFHIPILELTEENIDPSAIKLVSYEVAKRYLVFPVRKESEYLVLAVSNPMDIMMLDNLRFITRLQIKLVLSTPSEISNSIEKYYHALDNALSGLFKERESDTTIEKVRENEEEASNKGMFDLKELESQTSPAVKLTNLILSEAVRSRATDIHIEPQEQYIDVRYRIDGILRSHMKIPNRFRNNIVAHIKILTDLDIAETRKPQDGRVRIVTNGRKIDLRISIIPTFYGEKVALRLLDKQEAVIELAKIGLNKRELDLFIESVCRPQGIILVTGPTGSGKTSTLYAGLNFIRKSEVKNIVTIEDPIEYLIEGVNQMQVNTAKNVTFATGLRSILRQDPNVILVGEIRDKDTAEIAFRSALTGHLVLSTLHTNSAVSSITRLLNIGLEPYLIASSVNIFIAQRLIRVVCPSCKEQYVPSEEILNRFKLYIEKHNIKEFYRGKGCQKCSSTGFFGRAAVFEMLKVDDRIRSLITRLAPEHVIFREARKEGFKPLIDSGIDRVIEGLTTLEELARVTDIVEQQRAQEAVGVSEEETRELTDNKNIATFLKDLEKKLTDNGENSN